MSLFEPLHGIRTFVTAAKTGSFTAAAIELGIGKSAVGKSIARLEERLRVKLFHRTTRRLVLTADGEAYFATCTNALAEIAAMEETLSSRSDIPVGRLRIDLPAAYGRKVILPVLLRMAQKYPGLELTTTFSDHLIDPIEEAVDLLIRFGEVKESGDLVARSLGRQKLVVCASPGYLEAAGTPASILALKEHKCIVGYRRGQPLSWSLLDAQQAVTRIAPPPTHQMGDGEAILAASLAGCGLCQLPASLVDEHIAGGRLTPVLEELATFVDVNLIWPKTKHVLPKVRRVVDELVALHQGHEHEYGN
jgi:DNA-binding transcriptional LysR family regulator